LKADIFRTIHVADAIHLEELMGHINEILVDNRFWRLSALFGQLLIDANASGRRRATDHDEENFATTAHPGKIIDKIDEPLVLKRALRQIGRPRREKERDFAGTLLLG